MNTIDNTRGGYVLLPKPIDNTGGGVVRCEDKTLPSDVLLDTQSSVLACQGAVPPPVLLP